LRDIVLLTGAALTDSVSGSEFSVQKSEVRGREKVVVVIVVIVVVGVVGVQSLKFKV